MLHLLLEKYRNCRFIQQLRTIKNVLVHNARDEICKIRNTKSSDGKGINGIPYKCDQTFNLYSIPFRKFNLRYCSNTD